MTGNKTQATQVNFSQEMANFTFAAKYAKYDEKKGRREIWEETVARLEKMHLKKFNWLPEEDKKEISWAFDRVREKLVAPSMRSLQFGGKAIEAKNLRIYNCSVMHVNSLRSFAEALYLLLCGCGVGFGLSSRHMNKLPDLVNAKHKTGTIITYVVQDDIEGWADSVEALLMCYFKNTPYTGRKIVFDYSKIRAEGTPLKTGGGKAPGYKGLKRTHEKIKALLDFIIEDKKQRRLKTINAYDILMHCADAVLSGGIRRSACSVIFELSDKDMMEAKGNFKVQKIKRFVKDEDSGLYHGKVKIDSIEYDISDMNQWDYDTLKKDSLISWFYVQPQRARSNNSVLLYRDSVTFDQFKSIVQKTRECGEPGFVFANEKTKDVLFNPCQPAWAPILTKTGIKKLKDVVENDEIWTSEGWSKITKKWSTGIKDVYRYRTAAGVFYGTENHKVVSNGEKIEAGKATSIDSLVGQMSHETITSFNPLDVLDGLIIGDGTVHSTSKNKITLLIGKRDNDYFTYFTNNEIGEKSSVSKYSWNVNTSILHDELPLTYNRIIPDRYFYGNPDKTRGFLRGLFSANGTVIRGRVALKATSKRLVEQVQLMLSSIGISSYVTTNKKTTVKFNNGEYECKESYDLNISNIDLFLRNIGFIQKYKTDKAINVNKTKKKSKVTYDIIEKEYVSTEEVFDITVNNSKHTYWTGGVNVSNCFEISFIPIDADGHAGVQVCNLTTQNGGKITSKELFRTATKAATIIGTLQAAYTDFEYLSNTSKEITEKEALLGVSITGMMDNPAILLNPDNQREMAEYSKEVNEEWAKKLGISPCARTTCIKPEGTSSIILETASGIHPAHAKKYIRRIQCNKMDPVYKFIKANNPHACEESVWSANKTDDVVSFPITSNPGAMVKSDLTAIKHLEIIKSTQQNWVIPGTRDISKGINNNVSCTVIVGDNEWEEVQKYIYDNREYFTAVALIPNTGDKLYKQAPNEAVTTQEDEVKFEELMKKWKSLNFKDFKEEDDNTKLQQEAACAGGGCEVKAL